MTLLFSSSPDNDENNRLHNLHMHNDDLDPDLTHLTRDNDKYIDNQLLSRHHQEQDKTLSM
jgi:hypothetical protein